MRLIDADEFIKDRVENDPVRIATICAPTAYDVDKVVEQLNTEAMYEDAPVYEEDKEGDNYIRVSKAIEIVKAGGKVTENGTTSP